MIATAVTLLMMLGLAQIFKVLGDSMSQGRAGLELNNRLRGVMHRIRTDLDNVTVSPRPPIAAGTGQGYLKYYEGPASDYTLTLNPPIDPITGVENPLSRFGDMDDIFMATVKAKDTWFTGKVPPFIAQRRAPSMTDSNNDGIPDDLDPRNMVTIASQFAEVIIFAQPVVTSSNNVDRDPALLVDDPTAFEDVNGDGVPDSFRLHYRALLIRPDLNLDSGVLPALPAQGVMVARPELNLFPPEVFDMSSIHQLCDLSIRRVYGSGNPTYDYVAANTLEDLANPANRFAHVVYSLNPPSNTIYSMPVLALSPTLGFQTSSLPTMVGNFRGCGFLHPAFALLGDRTGEDVLATDLLAFDIRAYDPSAPILEAAGTTLRPGDPGYGTQVPITTANTVAYGEFVDLNWAGKLQFPYASEFSGVKATLPLSPTDALFRSGLVKGIGNPPASYQIFQPSYDTFTDLYEHDGVLQAELASGRGLVGFSVVPAASLLREPWRATAIDAGFDGIDNNPVVAMPNVPFAGPGVDDISERETSPPFPVDLRGLQISVRLESPSRKQFKQMSTIKEFVTH